MVNMNSCKECRNFKNSRICSSPHDLNDVAKVVSSHGGAVAAVCGFVHVLAHDIIVLALEW